MEKENQRMQLKSNRSDRSLQNAANTIVKLANKKIQQLALITQAQQNRKYTMVDKVNRLIDRQQHKLKHQQIPKDIQFYQKNMKKFENLSSFINSKGLLTANTSMPKLKMRQKSEENDQEYVDYLLAKNFKLRESRTHRNSNKAKLNYDQCWEMVSSDCDFESPVNVDKELMSAHQAQIKKDKDMEAKEEERRKIKLFKKGTMLEMGKSQRFSQKQLDEEQIIQSNLQLNVQHYKEQSDKVIRMIQHAAKKIYNKKEDQIKKEQMMSQIAKKFRQQQREMSKMEINKILASNQKQHLAFSTTVRHSQQKPELQETDHFFRKKKQVSRKTNPPPSFSPPCFSEEKSRGQTTILNSKIHDIVNRIDNIHVRDQDQTIRKMENEQIFYQTLRETLQQDQIKDTLKGLFLPMDHLQRRRLTFNKKHFQNQIL